MTFSFIPCQVYSPCLVLLCLNLLFPPLRSLLLPPDGCFWWGDTEVKLAWRRMFSLSREQRLWDAGAKGIVPRPFWPLPPFSLFFFSSLQDLMLCLPPANIQKEELLPLQMHLRGEVEKRKASVRCGCKSDCPRDRSGDPKQGKQGVCACVDRWSCPAWSLGKLKAVLSGIRGWVLLGVAKGGGMWTQGDSGSCFCDL